MEQTDHLKLDLAQACGVTGHWDVVHLGWVCLWEESEGSHWVWCALLDCEKCRTLGHTEPQEGSEVACGHAKIS